MPISLLQDLLQKASEKWPDKTAIIDGDLKLSYRCINDRSSALAAKIQKEINLYDRVAVYLNKSVEQVICYFAVLKAGGVVVLIDETSSEFQITHIINNCSARLLIYEDDKKNNIKKLLKNKDLLSLSKSSIESCSFEETIPVSQLIDDMAMIIYTSGSTGLAKGVVLSHRNILDGAIIVDSYLGIKHEDTILALLPLHFDYGLNQLMLAILNGAQLVLHKYIFPESLFKCIEKNKVTILPALPPVWSSVFNEKYVNLEKILTNRNLSSIRIITNTGGRLTLKLISKIRVIFSKSKIFLMYGLTEAFRSTYLEPKWIDLKPNSIGKAIPGVRVEIVDKNNKKCAPNEIGELVHFGALISKGYWGDPKQTAERFRQNPLLKCNSFLEKVVYSGDLAYKDEDGFIFFVGRKDEMIKISGYRISPTEVETLIMQHESIEEAVAFSVEVGEKIIIRAVISLTNPIELSVLKLFYKKIAPTHLIPKDFIILNTMPKTVNGKIDRSKIKKIYGGHTRDVVCQ
jgi:amino acid adenylation domain-containing protein